MASQRILIVDDEPDVLAAWKRALKNAGYSVQVSQTGKNALLLCEEHPFDLVILDFVMPTMDAVELLTRIRRQIPLIRSIIVSGRIADEVAEPDVNTALRQAVEADISLKKPLSDQRLIECIRELLDPGVSEKSWKDIAIRSRSAHKVTIKEVKTSARELKKRLIKSKRKK